LNDEEFARLAGWFGVPFDLEAGAAALARMFDVQAVCVTRGPRGAVLWHAGSFSAHPGFAVQVRDTVGSGDAFLAALVRGLLGKTPDAEILERANAAGAYVATQNGATPAIDESQVSLIASASAGGR
jgi:fructokinase